MIVLIIGKEYPRLPDWKLVVQFLGYYTVRGHDVLMCLPWGLANYERRADNDNRRE